MRSQILQFIFDIYFAHTPEVGCMDGKKKTDYYLASFLSRRGRVWAALYCLALAGVLEKLLYESGAFRL